MRKIDARAALRAWTMLLLTLVVASAAAACGRDSGEAEGEEHAEEGKEGEHKDEGVDAVQLDSAGIAAAQIRLAPATSMQTSGLPVTGTITYSANRVSHIGARADGRIIRMMADVGARVRGGQVMAILESPEVGRTRAEEHQAEALVRIANENYQRERRLEQQGISSRKELLDAEADLRRAQAELQSARARLQALGASHGNGSQFAVTAPFAGVVVARDASLGEMAGPSTNLFTVADLSQVWIELDVFERDLSRVSVGQRVDVTTAAYSGTTFPGRIVYVGDILDPEKRTVRARVEIQNPRGMLKPGMFANALIQVGGGGPPMVVVPQDAVQQLEGRAVVFIAGDQPGEFRAQPVETGQTLDGARVEIKSGITAGQQVVVSGAFALRSELAKGEIGEHGH